MVVLTLQAISDEDPRTGHEAESLLKAINTFVFYFYIIVMDALLKVTGALSIFKVKWSYF